VKRVSVINEVKVVVLQANNKDALRVWGKKA